MARGQQWHWSIREQAAPEALIGVISLMDDEPDNHRGFWLAPAWQGRGYERGLRGRDRLLVRDAGQTAAARAQSRA